MIPGDDVDGYVVSRFHACRTLFADSFRIIKIEGIVTGPNSTGSAASGAAAVS